MHSEIARPHVSREHGSIARAPVSADSGSPRASNAESLLGLQRRYGNRGVANVLSAVSNSGGITVQAKGGKKEGESEEGYRDRTYAECRTRGAKLWNDLLVALRKDVRFPSLSFTRDRYDERYEHAVTASSKFPGCFTVSTWVRDGGTVAYTNTFSAGGTTIVDAYNMRNADWTNAERLARAEKRKAESKERKVSEEFAESLDEEEGGPGALFNNEIIFHQHQDLLDHLGSNRRAGTLASMMRTDIGNPETRAVVWRLHEDKEDEELVWRPTDADPSGFYALLGTPNVRPSAFLLIQQPTLGRSVEKIVTKPRNPDKKDSTSVHWIRIDLIDTGAGPVISPRTLPPLKVRESKEVKASVSNASADVKDSEASKRAMLAAANTKQREAGAGPPVTSRRAGLLALIAEREAAAVQEKVPPPPKDEEPQAKLTVAPAGDACEQEADRVARAVVAGASGTERIHTRPSSGGTRSGSFHHDGAFESGISAARGKGTPLHEGVRAAMEGAIGADFSGVRVHTGAEADALNAAIEARAFTTGSDIFFRRGEYQPEGRHGQELLAHELTHVIQQGAAPAASGGVIQALRPRITRSGPPEESKEAYDKRLEYYQKSLARGTKTWNALKQVAASGETKDAIASSAGPYETRYETGFSPDKNGYHVSTYVKGTTVAPYQASFSLDLARMSKVTWISTEQDHDTEGPGTPLHFNEIIWNQHRFMREQRRKQGAQNLPVTGNLSSIRQTSVTNKESQAVVSLIHNEGEHNRAKLWKPSDDSKVMQDFLAVVGTPNVHPGLLLLRDTPSLRKYVVSVETKPRTSIAKVGKTTVDEKDFTGDLWDVEYMETVFEDTPPPPPDVPAASEPKAKLKD